MGQRDATYRANALPTCACGARLADAPLLSPVTGDSVCAACHARETNVAMSLAEPTAFRAETLRASVARTAGASLVAAMAWTFWFVSGTANNVIAGLLAALALGIFVKPRAS